MIKRKKWLFSFPFFLLTLVSFLFTGQEVKAETYAGNAIWPSEFVSNVYIKKVRSDGYIKYQQGRFIRRSEDNAFLYCLQPFVDIDNNHVYNVARSDYEIYLNMSEEQWQRINLLSYYGYGYGNHSDHKWYAITQVMIWRTADPTGDFFFTNTLNGTRNDSLFTSEINEIEMLVANHKKAPNINTNDITLPLGKSITLNDNNNVLSNYNILETANVNASINGNSLTITATGVGEAKIRLVRDVKIYNTMPVIYFTEGSQNVFRVGDTDPIFKSFKLNVVGGKVQINKKDKESGQIIPQGDASLKNAKYGIYKADTNELITTITTNDNAYAISDYLPSLGRFYLKELVQSEGYKLDTQKYYFNIDENNLLATVDVFEEVIKRGFEITKVVASDKTSIMIPEVGVKFGVYDSKNNLVLTETTDSEGKIYFTVPYGNYTLKQLSAPSGYEKIDDYKFEVRQEGKNINKVFSNAEITSRLKVVKVDDSGKIITKAGIKFKIKDLSNNKYVCQTISYPTISKVCEYETDENGILITPYPLNSGDYQLEEVDQVIYGYLWNKTPLKFSINENSNIQKTDDFDAILEIRFENKEVKGIIEINKKGEDIIIENGTFDYTKINLANVKFGLYDSDKNLIATLITDENGYAKIDNLKLGTYILKELESSNNNMIDSTEYKVELKYKDQYTPIIIATFNIQNYLEKGKLIFNKTDLTTGKEIPNVKVQVFTENDELVFEGITNKKGKIEIDKLFVGKFYIIETEAATGYRISDEKIFFEITENNQIVKANMTNEKIKSDLEFSKVDISTGKPLPNTLIEIYNAETDELLFNAKTNEEGKIIIKNLEYGKYYILEKEAPEGYKINEEKMFFEVTKDGEVIKATMEDEKIKSDLEFSKIDISTGIPLPDTLIEIYNAETNELVFSGRTDEKGKIIIKNLEYGKYYILEKEAPEGYKINEEKMFFEVTKDGEVIKVTMKDEKNIIEVPNTSSVSYIDMIAGIIVLVGAGLIVKSSKRKK